MIRFASLDQESDFPAMQPVEAIVIGASAGAVEALTILLGELSPRCQIPIFIVVHIPRDRQSLLPEILGGKCSLKICEAEDKEPILPGRVYLAPPDYHLLVESRSCLSLSCDPPVMYSRPSIDVLFESAADVFGPNTMGIVLTGANSDGAQGLFEIIKAGGLGVVQLPSEAYSSLMPTAAIAKSPNALVLSLLHISRLINELSLPS